MSKSEKLLFISHSSADKKTVDKLYNFLNNIVNIKNNHKYRIVYSSACDPNDTLHGQKLEEIIGKAAASNAFFAYLTQDYIESPDCLLELGAAVGSVFIKGPDKNATPKYLFIKDSTISSKELDTIGSIINKKISDSLVDEIEICLDIEINDVHKREFQNVIIEMETDNRKKNAKLDIQKAVSDIKRFIKSTFNNDSRLSDKPVIIYTDRLIYESLSMELARLAELQVIWTLYRSPLKNLVALNRRDKLTDYDSFFNTLTSDKKRLIIFETYDEANEYLDEKNILDSKYKQRKTAFEEMNKGNLYYTTVSEIKNAYHTHEKEKPRIEGETFFYEFAYIQSKEFDFIVFSEFSSEVHIKDTAVHPLIFIKAKDNENPYFGISTYENSSLLSKFISLNFETLLKENTIKLIC